MTRLLTRRAALLMALTTALAITGCATTSGPADNSASSSTVDGPFPVTVTSCGHDVTFDAPPERAVVNDNNMVELMFRLGLADRMAAYAGVGDNRMNLPEFADDYARIPSLGDDYFTLEPLLGADPDFVFAGWNYGFSDEDGITPDTLSQRGIPSYVLAESCRRVVDGMGPSSVADWYTDIRNIGAIFGVPDRADALIEQLQTTIDDVQTCLPPEVNRTGTVFTYLSGDDAPGTAPALTIVSELDRLSGGRNVFDDVNKMWGKVTWEEVVDRNPTLIVVVDYGTGLTGEQKIESLRTNPAIADVAAVRNNNFLVLPQNAVNPGPRIGEGIAARAAALYPSSCSTS
ncbi:ABC transporter substrate-binding protein [Rhodococcoides fascians A21d2]|uniref:ABC transporter substrate-binding protein n=1 Tax=Rhodococcoides fascians TaxID=1828 RepID=UPI00068D7E03|nr:ABC transporter substrate-binding protein [Rhodococcus fascians]QII00246.1 ABC transporter substrate-binding protein [Rhodococcus fascians A21d2]